MRQRIEHSYFCELCFPKHLPNMGKRVSEDRPEWVGHDMINIERALNRNLFQATWRILSVMDLKWEDVPHADDTCTCGRFNTGCEASPHLVRAESLPVESELAAFVWLPLRVRSGVPDAQAKVPIYVLDMLPERGEAGGSGVCS